MKIQTFEDLERLIALVNTHRIEVLEVDNIKLVKSTASHSIVETEQVRAGTPNERITDDAHEIREWDPMWDQHLLPNSRGDS